LYWLCTAGRTQATLQSAFRAVAGLVLQLHFAMRWVPPSAGMMARFVDQTLVSGLPGGRAISVPYGAGTGGA
jgi:hypothetical protein